MKYCIGVEGFLTICWQKIYDMVEEAKKCQRTRGKGKKT